MSEGDAQPVIYIEVYSGRTGREQRYRIPEGSPEWRAIHAALTAFRPTVDLVPRVATRPMAPSDPEGQ